MTNRQNMLNEYMYYQAYRQRQLLDVQVELLTSCNMKCQHCYLPKHDNGGLESELIKKMLDDIRNIGALNITFTGGEIFLRKDLLDLVSYARNLYLRVVLLSNGTCISEQQAEMLSNSFISDFSTTLFSMDEKKHDFITQSAGSFKKLMGNLSILKRYHIPVLVKVPIMNLNYTCIDEIKVYCEENGFRYMFSPTIFPQLDGNKLTTKYRLNCQQLSHVLKKIDSINGIMESHLKVGDKYDVLCPSFLYSLFVDASGDIYPCTNFQYKLGNLKETKVSDVWNNSKKMKYIQNIKKESIKCCVECEYKNQCERCAGIAFLETGDMFGCDPIAMEIAKIRHIEK